MGRSLALALALTTLAGCGPATTRPAPQRTAAEVAAVEIPNARRPLPGVLSGGQPTRAQLEEAAAAGYRTVVNLRPLDEPGAWDERPLVAELGMRFHHIPVAGTADLDRDRAAALAEILEDPSAQPVLVHCASGNRVGALVAIHAALLRGVSIDEALELGRRAGLTRLEEATRAYLESE